MAAFSVSVRRNLFSELRDAEQRAQAAALDVCGQKIKRDIRLSIRQKGLIRTGNYVNSWVVEGYGPATRDVRSKGAPYGAFLEYGHRANPGQVFPIIEGNTLKGFKRVKATFVPARPHVRPVADAWKSKIKQEFQSQTIAAWKRAGL